MGEMKEKYCKKCEKNHPLDREHWYFYNGKFVSPCKASRIERNKKYLRDMREQEKQEPWHKRDREGVFEKIDGLMGESPKQENPYSDMAEELRRHTMLMIKCAVPDRPTKV